MKFKKNLKMKRKRNKVFIIAEAGINHNGSMQLAKKLIDKAVFAGANAIKFQTFKSDNVISKYAKKLKYQQEGNRDKESQLKMLKKSELSYSNFKTLFKYCKKKKIIFLSTPKDLESAKFLNRLGVSMFKIGSGDILNHQLLRYVGSTNKHVILSTGMANLAEIKNSLRVLSNFKKRNISLLHCVSLYPTPLKLINLNTIKFLKKKFKINCGFSDHTLGDTAAPIAAAFGANIIEKHFTLNKKLKGPDHKLSLEPKSFKNYVKKIRDVEACLGFEDKVISKEESENIVRFRRGLVYLRTLKKNHILKKNDIGIKRPLLGLKPKDINLVIGKKLKKNVFEDYPIKLKDFHV